MLELGVCKDILNTGSPGRELIGRKYVTVPVKKNQMMAEPQIVNVSRKSFNQQEWHVVIFEVFEATAYPLKAPKWIAVW